jgi:hypothetical protein
MNKVITLYDQMNNKDNTSSSKESVPSTSNIDQANK